MSSKPSWMRRHKDKLDIISLETSSKGTRRENFTVRTKSKDSNMSINSSEMNMTVVDNQTLLNFDVEMPSELSVNGATSVNRSPLELMK